MKKRILIFLFLSLPLVNCGAAEKPAKTYRNPVIARNLPDPSIIRAADGIFYLYATESRWGLPVYKSKNLVDWEWAGAAFPKEARPDFVPNGGIWAPDINHINGKYVMYYSMSVWGKEWTCGIGVATADSPEGPFTDNGKLFRSNEIGVQNSIDQFYIEDNGKKYLFWGSFSGIYYIELSDDGLSVKADSKPKQVAGTAFEGTYIHKRGKYYYLFASTGTCCEGIESTYKLVVGRSESLLGRYTDKSGTDMLDNGHEVIIAPNERFVGNGHCSEIVRDKKGDDWIFYHGVDVENPRGRRLLLDKISWDKDDWPYVENHGTPSLEAVAPVF